MRTLLVVAAILLVAGCGAAFAGRAGYLGQSLSIALTILSFVLLTFVGWEISKRPRTVQTKINQLPGATAGDAIGHESPNSSDSQALDIEDFFESAAAGMRLTDPSGRILKANRAELDLLGYAAEDYLGRNIAEFSLDHEAIAGLQERVSRGETVTGFDTSLQAKDGSVRQVRIDANGRFENGRLVHIRSITRDVTLRREAEKEQANLLASAQAARLQAEDTTNLVRRLQVVVDTSLMGLSLDELLTEMLTRLRDLLDADAAAVLLLTAEKQGLVTRCFIGSDQAIARELGTGKGRGLAVHIAATRSPLLIGDLSRAEGVNGNLYELINSLVGAPLMIDGDVIGVIQAVSARKQNFKDDDLRLLQLLADRVALAIEQTRLYEAEQRARLNAESANRMKDEFVATLSHELRSPLNAIIGWAQLMRSGKLDEAAQSKALETVERSAQVQKRIINDLLDFSKVLSGDLRLNLRSIDITQVVESAAKAFKPAADAKAIMLDVRMLGDTEVCVDPERVLQIVWNLISNAIKFTPRHGRVSVVLNRSNSHLEIEVSDTGSGINREFLPFVFDRFRQADASSTRRQGGLGLGLAIVRHLTELHGGTVEAFSKGEGEGSTFVVKLPATPMDAADPAANRPFLRRPEILETSAEAGLSGLRVLLVDDDPDARELASLVLRQSSADVKAVGSAAEAMAIVLDEGGWRPDILVSDIEMPDADGYALIRQVREFESGQGPHLPAVALTAYARVEDRMNALAAGFQVHVPKPVEPAELLTVVASLAGRDPGSSLFAS
jgi:PAS domain S-box-containing protein